MRGPITARGEAKFLPPRHAGPGFRQYSRLQAAGAFANRRQSRVCPEFDSDQSNCFPVIVTVLFEERGPLRSKCRCVLKAARLGGLFLHSRSEVVAAATCSAG